MDQVVAAVSKLRVSRDDAFSAWFEGEFECCLGCCDALEAQGDGTREVTLLRARALLRIDRPAEALDVLERLPAEGESSDGELTRRMLIASALTRLGNAERGLEELRRIRALMQRSHPAIQSEVTLNIGLAYYALRNLEAADAALDAIPSGADIIHARSLEYKGWVASARGDYRTAAAFFSDALTRLDGCQRHDGFLELNCLQALAHLAVDGLERSSWQTIVTRRASLRSEAGSLSYPEFRLTLSAATFENDIEGRPVEATVEARRAYDLAPTPAFRVLALCKRASIARHAGEPIAQLDHLQAAVDAFAAIDVRNLNGDERLVPLAVAEELANASRSAEARRYFEAYRARSTTGGTLAVTGDSRREAYEQLVEAQILEAESRKSEAASLYRKVQDRSMVSSVRCALIAAIRLGYLTGDTRHLLGYAELAAREVRSSSWIHSALKNLRIGSAVSSLSSVQSECLLMVCRGYSNGKIAQLRGRSENTVRNQVATLFETFNVRNRAELTAEYLNQTGGTQPGGAFHESALRMQRP